MSVNIDLDDYYVAQELLDKSDNLFLNSKDDIASVLNTLDGQVLAYVRSDLKQAQSTISLLQKNNDSISEEITVQVEKVAAAEAKAKEALSEITGATEAETKPLTGNEKTWEKGKSALSSIGDFFVSLGKGIVNVGASLVSGTVSLLTGNLGGLFDSCKSIFNAACDIGKSFFSFVKKSFDFVASFFASAVASVANLVMSLVEGIVSFVEAIVDAAAMIVGVAASLFTGLYDGINWIGSKIFGYEFKSATKAMWADGIMPFIGTDWTGKAFDALYTIPPFTWMESYAFGPFKREGGIVYKIGKGVGYTVGIVAATVFTCGVAGGTSVVASLGSTGVSTAFAGLGAMGKNTQKGYNKLSDEEKQDGWALFKVGAYGVASGAVEAGAWYLTFGGGKGTLLKNQNINGAFGKSADGLNKVFGLSKNSSFMFKASNIEKAVVQIGKTYATASNDYVFFSDDVSVSGYVNDVLLSKENLTDAAIAGGVSLLYDATAGNYLKNQLEGKAKVGEDGQITGKDGYLTKWMNRLKTPETKPTTAGETLLPGMGGAQAGADGAQEAIVSGGLGTRMKDATIDVISQGGASKIYNNLPKKFYDYRNILELFATG